MDERDVWRIKMRGVGVLGHVLQAPDGKITYQVPEDLADLLKQQIDKIAHMPASLHRALVREFFSCYLQSVSGELCWAELLPNFKLDAHVLDIDGLGSSKRVVTSAADHFIYLRRFAHPIPTLSIVSNAVYPASVSYVPAKPGPRSIRSCYFFDHLLHRRAYARVAVQHLDGNRWLADVARMAANAQGVVIDTYLFSMRGESVATGLEAEMALSMMLPLDAARVYIAREHDSLPPWVPEQLVVRVPRQPAALQRARRRVERSIAERLHVDLQHAWRPFYQRCHNSWERVMALAGIRYDSERGVIPWDAA